MAPELVDLLTEPDVARRRAALELLANCCFVGGPIAREMLSRASKARLVDMVLEQLAFHVGFLADGDSRQVRKFWQGMAATVPENEDCPG
jgi:hypothetical protein